MSTYSEQNPLAFVEFKNEVVGNPLTPAAPRPINLNPTQSAYFEGARRMVESPLVVSYRNGVLMEHHRDFKEARKEGYQPITGNPLRWGIYGYTRDFCREMGWAGMAALMVDRGDFEAFTLKKRIEHVRFVRWLFLMSLELAVPQPQPVVRL